jgi:iron complex transport system substrate-binding protein
MIYKFFCLVFSLCFILGCNIQNAKEKPKEKSVQSKEVGMPTFIQAYNAHFVDSIRYAKGFEVMQSDGYVQVEIKDPWNKGKLLQRYLLVPRNRPIPESLPAGTIVRVPLRKMVVYAAVHVTVLDELGVLDEIIGVCEARYVKDSTIHARIEKGMIHDLGKATSPNIEKMLALGAEVILASPFENASYGAVEKTGIPIIECADYMEANPLGRAEWIKFVGLLTGTGKVADSLFRATEANYYRIKALTENMTYRPKLMTELRYGNTWYVSGGESYMANIYKDAGLDYLFAYLPGTGGIPLSFETVLDKAIHADLWTICYNRKDEMTYQALQADFYSYNRFDPFRNRRVYGCNTNYSPYYEEVPIHPDYLLEELIAIGHPYLLPNHTFRYFKPLK